MQGGLSVSLVHKWPASGTYGADDGDLVQAPCKGLCGFLADLRSALPLPGGSRGAENPNSGPSPPALTASCLCHVAPSTGLWGPVAVT